MYNSKTEVDVLIQQSYLWYGSSTGDFDSQASGAYIFRPNGAPPTVVSRSVPLKVIRGALVDEIHQEFNSWIYQIGPIPTDDGVGKEVITRLATNMETNKVFYTDSNGRDFLKRLNLGIFMLDKKSELSVLVDCATGGANIADGQLELMLHKEFQAV
ncbi:alpha-mannosidase-like isoform X9 [Humulus lupulus]|uniref:alpha-mannosidase-like isoform X9 n=1 Tax=Humulus lupulus TaxID=3486 RepID=UPI002B4126F2|nr:alpha-mannosidase-like isoform X9 [Humulus lupulus]